MEEQLSQGEPQFHLPVDPQTGRVELPREYHRRGWCHFESSVSTILRQTRARTWRRIIQHSRNQVKRQAPVPPSRFKQDLVSPAKGIHFTNQADVELVFKLYEDTFIGGLAGSPNLTFADCGWTDEQAICLAESLDYPRVCGRGDVSRVMLLNLRGNPGIGTKGCDALAKAIELGATPRLVSIAVEAHQWQGCLKHVCEERGIENRTVVGWSHIREQLVQMGREDELGKELEEFLLADSVANGRAIRAPTHDAPTPQTVAR